MQIPQVNRIMISPSYLIIPLYYFRLLFLEARQIFNWTFFLLCRWFCHFDDDNYVNVPRLVRFLGDYSPREDWYLGKPSIQAPLEIITKDKATVSQVIISNYFLSENIVFTKKYD